MSSSTTGDSQQFLTRFGLVALGVVVGAALLFVAIDAVGGSETADDPAPGAGGPTVTPTSTASATGGGEATDQATEATDQATEAPDQATEGGTGEVVTPSATANPTAGATSDPVADIAPEEISIQVLDGIRDGSNTARSIADDLEAQGHELIAFGNSSRNYDQTTVFYSEGQQDAGRQVAATNDWEVVRPASEVGLSTSVDVHVVVGADAG